jgi:hypothetical protein
MKARCLNPAIPNYHLYGGRGIKVCDRWRDSFENFFADMGKAPYRSLSIDRIDNNGGYKLGNCKWSTNEEQANNKRTNHVLTFNGRSQTLAQWADELRIKRVTLQARITRYGWSVERALTTPVRRYPVK